MHSPRSCILCFGQSLVDIFQLDGPDTACDVQPFLRLQAQRLQRKRLVATPNQEVGPGTDRNSRFGRQADIFTFQCAFWLISRWGQNRPPDNRFLGDANVDPDLNNAP